MAIVTLTFDTVKKTAAAEMDGKAIKDFSSAVIYFCKDYESGEMVPCCNITTAMEDEENGYKSYTSIVASESPEGKALASIKESEKYPGFKETSPLALELTKLLGK